MNIVADLWIAPVSHFRLSSRAGPSTVHTRSQVTLKKTICVTDTATGNVKLVELDDTVTGHIYDRPLGKGSMKYAYEVCGIVSVFI